MPTFTAIAFDRLLEPGASKSMATGKNVYDSRLERRSSTPSPKVERPKLERGISVPNSKPERRNNKSTIPVEKNHRWVQISPALYATPKSTPLPDSPTSFPPSPYIINHKRRGPRLLKSYSEDDVATRQRALEEEKPAENARNGEREVIDSDKDVNFTLTVPSPVEEVHVNGVHDGEFGSSEFYNRSAGKNDSVKSVTFDVERNGEVEDFFDPQDSMSVKSSIEGESSSGVERPLGLATPMTEFYDAWEELSSESVSQPPLPDVEAELREIRLNLLMEIEKRKQTEEALDSMRNQWLRIRQQLSLVGLTLPADCVSVAGDEQDYPAEEMCRQVYLARLVSNSIGRGTAKAEVEVEMEAQIESKNFEIARLWDRLHYYEAVNREMSQRNQEVVETARRLRQRRKRRQRWVWGSIATAITLGTAALAWSYLPDGKGSSSSTVHQSDDPKGNHLSK